MDTFKDLYEFLQIFNESNIIEWLKDHWVGKDKQESLLRLFAGLGLIDKLKGYNMCKGNFNRKTIVKNSSLKDLFYNQENNLLKLKDKGDASDLTGCSKVNEKHLLLTTSKNLNKTQVGKLDIDKILTNFQQYQVDGFTMSLCICIRDKNDFQNNKYFDDIVKNDSVSLCLRQNRFAEKFSKLNLDKVSLANKQKINKEILSASIFSKI